MSRPPTPLYLHSIADSHVVHDKLAGDVLRLSIVLGGVVRFPPNADLLVAHLQLLASCLGRGLTPPPTCNALISHLISTVIVGLYGAHHFLEHSTYPYMSMDLSQVGMGRSHTHTLRRLQSGMLYVAIVMHSTFSADSRA